jgi:acyl-coenzyme A synthetase/AMP-(fatty) acid ligase/3-hydroxymyristoyl/3-hydroxydecanoyl-(acyl carrier protein) dehydratase
LTSERYTLLGATDPSAPVALGRAGARNLATLGRDVAWLAAALPVAEGEQAWLACADRYLFAVGLLALWQRGAVAALPATSRPDALLSASGVGAAVPAVCLIDEPLTTGLTPSATRIIHVPACLAAAPTVGPSAPFESIEAARPLVVLHTSGTTGDAVTVAKTAAQLLGEVALLLDNELTHGSRGVMSTVPARHIYGLLFGVLWPLRRGIPFVRETPLLAEAVAHTLQQTGADTLVAVPAHLGSLAALPGGALSGLARVLSSGSPLPRAHWQGLSGAHGLAVHEILGSTEAGGIGHRAAPDAPFTPFADVHIDCDSEAGLLLDSPRLDASWSRPASLPDRVRLLPDGRFEHLGRVDGVVKVGGTRVSLTALEAAACESLGALAAVALAVPVESARGHELWLVLEGVKWELPAVRERLAARFEAVALPRRLRCVERLPREPTGKLRRAALLHLFANTESTLARPGYELRCWPEAFDADAAGESKLWFEAQVPADSALFDGHFPGQPVLPGVAQLQALVVDNARRRWPRLLAPLGFRAVKFLRPIQPLVPLQVTLTRSPSGDCVDFRIESGAALCSTGRVRFAGERTP